MAEEKVLSLDELKELNDAEEAAEATRLAAAEEAETDDDDDDLESDSDDDSTDDDTSDDDADDDKDKDPPAEAWMASEEDEPDDLKFTDGDAAAIRKKYKARADVKDAENERLLQELEDLKKQKAASASPMKAKPKRDDFDSEDEFHEAVTDYKIDLRDSKNNASNASAAKKQALDLQNKEVSKDLDAHYVRAHALAAKSNIKAETYQAADLKVRRALEGLFPKDGDAICDKLISITGEGSEKVFYHLGVNPTKLDKFIGFLKSDPLGMAASSYLGRLNAELAQPAKRGTKAPAPVKEIQGDKRPTAGSKNLLKQYNAAHKNKEAQKAFNIRKKAKEAGVDVSGW